MKKKAKKPNACLPCIELVRKMFKDLTPKQMQQLARTQLFTDFASAPTTRQYFDETRED